MKSEMSLFPGQPKLARTGIVQATMVACAILIANCYIPTGVNVAVGYIAVVWLIHTTERKKSIWIAAGICSLLTVIGFMLSPGGSEPNFDFINRCLALLAIWSTAIVCVRNVSLLDHHGEIELKVRESERLAQQANQTKSEFLANMSHEIRTPMAAILGHADVLLDHLEGADNRDCVIIIKRNGNYLLDLINDVLDLSRIEAGKLEIELESCRLGEFLADICSLMHVRVRETNVKLIVVSEGLLPTTIESDPKRLKQILINLLGNAIKFTESGQVTLRVQYFQDDDESTIRFEVEDTGIGIKEEHLGVLFESFSQGDATINRKYGGSGLGLTISKRLVETLGGALTVKSELGVGSTFAVELPCGPSDGVPFAAIQIDHVALDPYLRKITTRLSCRVLLVDDRRDVRLVAQHFLEEAGAVVETATDGREGILAVSRSAQNGQPFDVIVMDMQMPNMDGYAAASELRSTGCELPVIAMTADAMRGDRERCLDVGCDDYLPKPIEPFDLVEKVCRVTQDTSIAMLRAERARRKKPMQKAMQTSAQ